MLLIVSFVKNQYVPWIYEKDEYVCFSSCYQGCAILSTLHCPLYLKEIKTIFPFNHHWHSQTTPLRGTLEKNIHLLLKFHYSAIRPQHEMPDQTDCLATDEYGLKTVTLTAFCLVMSSYRGSDHYINSNSCWPGWNQWLGPVWKLCQYEHTLGRANHPVCGSVCMVTVNVVVAILKTANDTKETQQVGESFEFRHGAELIAPDQFPQKKSCLKTSL